MGPKNLSMKKGLVITFSFVLVLVGSLFASQSYLSYLEVSNAANKCYDNGGFPTIEKYGFKMVSFSCEMD